MKYPIRILAATTLLLYTSSVYAIIDTYKSIPIFKVDSSPENKISTHPKHNRLPQKTLRAIISTYGIEIPGVDNNDIISFEIYTANGICMGIFSDEMDFIETLFSLSGEYEIRILTDYAVFAGIIEI